MSWLHECVFLDYFFLSFFLDRQKCFQLHLQKKKKTPQVTVGEWNEEWSGSSSFYFDKPLPEVQGLSRELAAGWSEQVRREWTLAQENRQLRQRRFGRGWPPKLISRAVQHLSHQSVLWVEAINQHSAVNLGKNRRHRQRVFDVFIGDNMAECSISIDKNKLPGVKEGNVHIPK